MYMLSYNIYIQHQSYVDEIISTLQEFPIYNKKLYMLCPDPRIFKIPIIVNRKTKHILPFYRSTIEFI